jgi:hypothetical protein
VPVDVYNERILPIGTDLIGGMANGQISMVEGLAAWETFLREVDVLR